MVAFFSFLLNRCSCLLMLLSLSAAVQAHEVRPAYLEISEEAGRHYAMLWKVPAKANRRMGLYLQIPEQCRQLGTPDKRIEGGAYLERLRLHCASGLEGEVMRIRGLESTLTDALVRYVRQDDSVQVIRVMPQSPGFTLQASPSAWATISTYLRFGIEHILNGIDHLLFVLALMILVKKWRRLVATITAFTLSHSITLVSSTLGLLKLPQAPVEAIIALSIAFVACEIIHGHRDQPGINTRWTWVVAFSFGLLHGFGFAGALTEIGLPQTDLPLALLMFNIGVEIGQLFFFFCVTLLMLLIRSMVAIDFRRGEVITSYIIGSCATYWLYVRLGGIIS